MEYKQAVNLLNKLLDNRSHGLKRLIDRRLANHGMVMHATH